MEYIDLFNQISLGTLIAWILAIGFLVLGIYKFVEKYRAFRNDFEKRNKKVLEHDVTIENINKDLSAMNNKIDNITDILNKVVVDADQREARRLRREILKFSDNIRNGKTPSKDAFQDIIESNAEYENIIAKRQIKNGFTEHEMVFIENKYDELYGG